MVQAHLYSSPVWGVPPAASILRLRHGEPATGLIVYLAPNAGTDTLDRFIWVMSFLARNDFVVIPVDQLQFDDSILADRFTWGKVGSHKSL